jgi:hypothetical protein
MTTSSGPARTSATSAGSSTSGGPNSRITTARTPGLLHRNDAVRYEPIVAAPLSRRARRAEVRRESAADDRYKWVTLANTTASMFMATLDGSIVIIAPPAA